MGLAGFGIGLVGLAFLPWVMAPGVLLFERIDAVRFRRLVFGLLFGAGIVLLARG